MNWYIKTPDFKEESDYYIQPFDGQLWLSIFAALLTGTIFGIILYLSQRKRFELLDLLFMSFDHICSQGKKDFSKFLTFSSII